MELRIIQNNGNKIIIKEAGYDGQSGKNVRGIKS